jgi:SWIM zinc finger
MGPVAKAYVAQIDHSQWRSTAWLDDEALPPRYGIVTSNMSESANSMFEKARDMPWKTSVHIILSKMVERITIIGKRKLEKSGAVDHVSETLKGWWEHSVGFTVIPMKNSKADLCLFTVVEQRNGLHAEESRSFNMNVRTKACDCGVWQEHGYPCIHGVAYFKGYKKYTFDDLLGEVNEEYTYKNDKMLFETNFLTVCLDKVVGDGKTLAPAAARRKAGRPKKKRFRKHSRLSQGSNTSSSVRCSCCGEQGHHLRPNPNPLQGNRCKKRARVRVLEKPARRMTIRRGRILLR